MKDDPLWEQAIRWTNEHATRWKGLENRWRCIDPRNTPKPIRAHSRGALVVAVQKAMILKCADAWRNRINNTPKIIRWK